MKPFQFIQTILLWAHILKQMLVFFLGMVFYTILSPEANLQINPKRMEERIQALSQFGKNPEGGVSRDAFSDADIEGRNYIQSLMKKAGLEVRIDMAGNIIGRKEGRNSSLHGSHP